MTRTIRMLANGIRALDCPRSRAGLLAAGLMLFVAPVARGQSTPLLDPSRLVQVPGPNPLLRLGPDKAWDSGQLEVAAAIKDRDTYYLFYQASGDVPGWQIGVATSPSPLGPFQKQPAPIVTPGPAGAWDDLDVASGAILREGSGRWAMWYSARQKNRRADGWSVGLATAPSPLGPWTKYKSNPLVKGFGRVGGVVKAKGKYLLYGAEPSDNEPGRGPIVAAVGDSLTGRYIKGGPVLMPGETGEWDHGGFTDSGVFTTGDRIHLFASGATANDPPAAGRDSIGYAYSVDGKKFSKYGRNPVAQRVAIPSVAGLTNVRAIFEPPLIYLYHTLRFPRDESSGDATVASQVGVQVLAMERPFRFQMPVLQQDILPPERMTLAGATYPICLSTVKDLALTVSCVYAEKATSGVRLHVVSSPDGVHYDTRNLETFDDQVRPGSLSQSTYSFSPKVRYVVVFVENLDKTENVTKIEVTATVGG